uniref:Uncharacterized protein n=1 Tax=Ascaris lumbricoides TaxID=6252 RepID=A0A0M3I089_ASCLU
MHTQCTVFHVDANGNRSSSNESRFGALSKQTSRGPALIRPPRRSSSFLHDESSPPHVRDRAGSRDSQCSIQFTRYATCKTNLTVTLVMVD